MSALSLHEHGLEGAMPWISCNDVSAGHSKMPRPFRHEHVRPGWHLRAGALVKPVAHAYAPRSRQNRDVFVVRVPVHRKSSAWRRAHANDVRRTLRDGSPETIATSVWPTGSKPGGGALSVHSFGSAATQGRWNRPSRASLPTALRGSRGSERSFLKAIELDGDYAVAHHWYSQLLSILGRHDEARREIEAARHCDPLSPVIAAFRSYAACEARRYDAAVAAAREALELDATPAVHAALAFISARSGGRERAAAILDDLRQRLHDHYVSPIDDRTIRRDL